MRKRILGLVVGIVAIASVFYMAGTWAWWNAWLFMVLMAIIGGVTSQLFRQSPGLAEERRTAASKSKPWDVYIVWFLNAALPCMVVIAAFDQRFHWLPPVPTVMSAVAIFLMILAATLTYYAIAANPFFSSHVRIQKERGHRVMTTGPYRTLRHPGYLGSSVFNLSVPLVLGSWLSLPLGIAVALLLIYRTAKEDQVLKRELAGYSGYARQVHYRLIPGIW